MNIKREQKLYPGIDLKMEYLRWHSVIAQLRQRILELERITYSATHARKMQPASLNCCGWLKKGVSFYEVSTLNQFSGKLCHLPEKFVTFPKWNFPLLGYPIFWIWKANFTPKQPRKVLWKYFTVTVSTVDPFIL